MKADDLQKHMTATYYNLRLGMVVLALALPVLLWLGALIRANLPLQGSMSAYYYSVMRDVFVGVLFAIGACLFLYEGFSKAEGRALNVAGILAVAIALFPTESQCEPKCKAITAHAVFALAFFLCIAYVCWFRASDTLSLIRDGAVARKYWITYRLFAVGMVTSPLVAVLLTRNAPQEGNPRLFIAEACAVYMFALYWYVKRREIKATQADTLALQRKLKTSVSKNRPAHAIGNIQVEQDEDQFLPPNSVGTP